jgi:hypothetical protein
VQWLLVFLRRLAQLLAARPLLLRRWWLHVLLSLLIWILLSCCQSVQYESVSTHMYRLAFCEWRQRAGLQRACRRRRVGCLGRSQHRRQRSCACRLLLLLLLLL